MERFLLRIIFINGRRVGRPPIFNNDEITDILLISKPTNNKTLSNQAGSNSKNFMRKGQGLSGKGGFPTGVTVGRYQ